MKWFLPLSAMVVLAIMVAWMAGSFDDKVPPEITEIEYILPTDDVSFYEVKSESIELLEPVPATIAAKQTAVISSRILARIDEMKVRAGDYVKKGQVLVVLERSDLQSRVSQANAQVKSVEARLVEAKQAFDRAVELNKRGLLAQAPLDAAQANFKSLQAQSRSVQQALVEAETALDYAKVVAPFDGLIVDRFAEPGSTAQPGMSLLSLYNPSSVRVEANVREERAVQLSLGQSLKMDIPSKNFELSAEIEELVPAGNSASRTFLVKSQINDITGLLPGMYARIHIPAGSVQRILIPADYVAQVGQLTIVWVVQSKNDKRFLEKRFVKTGLAYDDGKLEIVSGLQGGETLAKVPE